MNDPVNNVDPSGHMAITTAAILIGVLIGAGIGAISAGYESYKDGNDLGVILLDSLGGALIGGALGAAMTVGGLAGAGLITAKAAVIGLGVTTLASFGAGASASLISDAARGNELDWGNALNKGFFTAVESVANFGFGYAMGASGLWKSLGKGHFGRAKGKLAAMGVNKLCLLPKAGAVYFKMNGAQLITRVLLRKMMSDSFDLFEEQLF